MEFVAGRREVLAYHHGYHGHAGFAALVTGSPGENINDYYNLPREHGRFFDAHGDLAAVENLFDRDIAAAIVEPMDYETFALPPPSFLPGLADPAHHAAIGPALFRRGILGHGVSAIAPYVAKFFPPLTSPPDVADAIADALDDIARAWRNSGPDAARARHRGPTPRCRTGPRRGVVIARSRLSWMSSRPLASRPSTGERTAPPRPRWVFPPRSA